MCWVFRLLFYLLKLRCVGSTSRSNQQNKKEEYCFSKEHCIIFQTKHSSKNRWLLSYWSFGFIYIETFNPAVKRSPSLLPNTFKVPLSISAVLIQKPPPYELCHKLEVSFGIHTRPTSYPPKTPI